MVSSTLALLFFFLPDFPILSRAAAAEGQCPVEYRGYFVRRLIVAWWPGGLVAWWPGGPVARWPCGLKGALSQPGAESSYVKEALRLKFESN